MKKKPIEMFTYEADKTRIKNLWAAKKRNDTPYLALFLISGILLGLIVVYAVLNIHGLIGALNAKFDTHPFSGLMLLVISAMVILYGKHKRYW